MDPSTHRDAYFTNLLNNNDFLMSATNEQELSPPQVEVIEIEPSGRKIQRGNNFSNEEDLLLVEGWLETSLDAVQGKDQKHTMLWKRIHKYFEENKKFDFLRNYTSLMNRWSTIQQATNKFYGYLAQVEGMHPSGFNEQDKIGKAKVMFLELEKKSFNFDHCWRVLRFHPKWVEHMDMVKPKKKPSKDDDFHVASSNLERPIGQMTNSDSLVVLNEMAEIRKSKLVLMQEARDHDNKMLCFRQEEVSLKQDELRIQKEKVLLQQVKTRLEEKKEDERIMTLNTSAMPPMLQQYYLQRQMEILASRAGKN
ncbi:hypothetical protein I3842_08G122800 [Carya illinoinensis]|uniref:No apical meristem-associated C-terminal domain-containing protein n=1 Tax=Carya illinoinensis TaxID=32201 RepID=A0A922EBS7_CARIL|nr:hypothetical protein I3842_08G122800 [Carya illinoinensis]